MSYTYHLVVANGRETAEHQIDDDNRWSICTNDEQLSGMLCVIAKGRSNHVNQKPTLIFMSAGPFPR
jgi:hypothetical protein